MTIRQGNRRRAGRESSTTGRTRQAARASGTATLSSRPDACLACSLYDCAVLADHRGKGAHCRSASSRACRAGARERPRRRGPGGEAPRRSIRTPPGPRPPDCGRRAGGGGRQDDGVAGAQRLHFVGAVPEPSFHRAVQDEEALGIAMKMIGHAITGRARLHAGEQRQARPADELAAQGQRAEGDGLGLVRGAAHEGQGDKPATGARPRRRSRDREQRDWRIQVSLRRAWGASRPGCAECPRFTIGQRRTSAST